MADSCGVIRTYDDYPVNDGMLEKLDEMLNQYNVPHFFTLPDGDDEGFAIDQTHVAKLYYESENHTACIIVYMLWLKTIRNVPDEKIAKVMMKTAERIRSAE